MPETPAIAIVGMACRFPGGIKSPGQHRKFLAEGRNACGEVPVGRWEPYAQGAPADAVGLALADLDGQRAYWRTVLAGVPNLAVPVGATGPAGVAVAEYRFDPPTWAGIADLARHRHTTPLVVLLHAYADAVGSVTGRRDCAISTPIVRRGTPLRARPLGCFIAMLSLRLPPGGGPLDPTDVQRAVSDALAHQDAPFGELVRLPGTPGTPGAPGSGRTPVHQTMFAIQDNPRTRLCRADPAEPADGGDPAPSGEFVHFPRRRAAFELIVEVWPAPDGSARIDVTRDSARIGAEFAHEVAQQFPTSLRASARASAPTVPPRPATAAAPGPPQPQPQPQPQPRRRHPRRPRMTAAGLSHIELCVADAVASAREFAVYGFAVTGMPDFDATVPAGSLALRQGACTLVLTQAAAGSAAGDYVARHGDGVADLALAVPDAAAAFAAALTLGAAPVAAPVQDAATGAVTATVAAFGDVAHTFVQAGPRSVPGLPPGFRAVRRAVHHAAAGDGPRLAGVDHVAVCLEPGRLASTTAFYRQVLGFRTIFEERVAVGDQALLSAVVQDPSRRVTLTLLQPDPAARPGQLDDFLERHDGPGVQHIAFATTDIVQAVRGLRGAGVGFLATPDSYYRGLAPRLGPPCRALDDLREFGILVDQDHDGRLFRIFTRSTHPRRTLFHEVIERQGARTFGSGNIPALYEAAEAEQHQAAERGSAASADRVRG